ncbi:hypothetical protein ACFQ0R_04340 [Psychroflexus salinarum]|uniref:Uncharacterized protein n=1 Tax=Psychroflexus salinarum TaxID=546024 RepID=A0ABW3GQ79_9FLAO
MKINKTGFYALNAILILTIIFGHYELVSINTLVAVFVTPAFIVAVSLAYKSRKEKSKNQ